MRDVEAWAADEFGGAELGDARRTRRLVQLVGEVARRPAGTVTKACQSSASREGAFRILENGAVRPSAVAAAVFRGTIRRCTAEQTVFVAVDSSSLTLTDEAGSKEIGGVGAWDKGARGVQTMTAFAVSSSGAPLGICDQRMWVRRHRSLRRSHSGQTLGSESRFWAEVLVEVHSAFRVAASATRPWFQMDRGADCWALLRVAIERGALLTVRAAYDRPLVEDGRLWDTLQRAPILAKRRIEVPARAPSRRKRRVHGKRTTYWTKPRRARTTSVTIRAAPVTIECRTHPCFGATVPINAVFVREQRHGADRLEWMLLTTHPIRTRRDVLAVVDGYALRWRVEDFHRAWKGGLCRVEDTQLRSRDAIFKWATILAAVATRAMRLTYLARDRPDIAATTEFSRIELKAILALREPKGVTARDLAKLPLAQAVRWVADIGGYTGPWNGPPGPTVIGRGLHDVLIAARALGFRDKKR